MPQSIARAQQLQGDRSLGEMQAVGRGWLKACNFGRGRAWSAYFLGGAMVSLAALATRNLTTVLALILIGSPVWGLRPMRALRSALTSLPMPGMVNSPFFLVSLTAISASSSRPAAACLLVISSFSAIVRTRTVLVIPFAMCVAPWIELVVRSTELVLRIALLNAVCDLPLPRWAGSRKRLCCEISGVYAGARKRTAFHDQPFAEDCQWVLRGFHRFFAGFLGFCAILGTKWAILRGIIGGPGCVGVRVWGKRTW